MQALHVLIVEDNEGDILLITEALEKSKSISKISVTRDGLEAIKLLEAAIGEAPETLPDCVFLDINLPIVNGFEVLAFIKSNISLRHIPVFILTTSGSQKDILTAYQGYASCYLTKSFDYKEFQETMRAFEECWFQKVMLPIR